MDGQSIKWDTIGVYRGAAGRSMSREDKFITENVAHPLSIKCCHLDVRRKRIYSVCPVVSGWVLSCTLFMPWDAGKSWSFSWFALCTDSYRIGFHISTVTAATTVQKKWVQWISESWQGLPQLHSGLRTMCIQLSVDRFLAWFHILDTVTRAAINMGVQIILSYADVVLFRWIPRSGMTESYGRSIFRFLRNRHTMFCNN